MKNILVAIDFSNATDAVIHQIGKLACPNDSIIHLLHIVEPSICYEVSGVLPDEVRLTNIEDKNRPIRFSESIQYVRAYVEDAGTAIYDTIPKKPAARESIRDKLKSAQKAQPPHTPKPQKNKGKDMEL